MRIQDPHVLPLAPLCHRYISEKRTLEHSVFTLALVPLNPKWAHAPCGRMCQPLRSGISSTGPWGRFRFLGFPSSLLSLSLPPILLCSPFSLRALWEPLPPMLSSSKSPPSPCFPCPRLAPGLLSPNSMCSQGSYSPISQDCRTTRRSWCDGCRGGAGVLAIPT